MLPRVKWVMSEEECEPSFCERVLESVVRVIKNGSEKSGRIDKIDT